MTMSTNQRVQKRRDALRAAGLRPLQIWIPDTRQTGFDAECARQAQLVADSERHDTELMQFLDAALADIGED